MKSLLYIILISCGITILIQYILEKINRRGKKAKAPADLSELFRENRKAREVFKKSSPEIVEAKPSSQPKTNPPQFQSNESLHGQVPKIRETLYPQLRINMKQRDTIAPGTMQPPPRPASSLASPLPASESNVRMGMDELPTINLQPSQEALPPQDKVDETHWDQEVAPAQGEEIAPLAIPALMTNPQVPHLSIKRILAPIVVEQGQRDEAITIVVHNPAKVPAILTLVALRLYREQTEITIEYKIRAKVGNPNTIAPGAIEEICLSVDVSENATLGKITLMPVVMAILDIEEPQPADLSTSRLFQWRVEPTGRIFRISTEHQGMETAGIPFSLTLETYLHEELDKNYQGTHRIFMSLMNISSSENTSQFPEYLDLTFEQGKAIAERCFCFYNTIETYILCAKDTKPGGAEGSSTSIMIAPAVLGSFRIELATPQKNGVPLEGENTLAALDIFGNVKSDYHGDVILCCPEGTLKGIPNSTITGNLFQQGIVNLTPLKLRICVPEFDGEGKVARVIARAESKIGRSNDITILPAAEMSVSATQAMIRRLWGHRSKRIWIANAEIGIARELEANFQSEYEVLVRDIRISDIEMVQANPPDVFFLDVENSPEDGYQLMRDLRKSPNMESLPMFILGAANESESRIMEVLRSGGVYVAKPLSFPALRAMVSDLLQNLAVEQGQMPSRGARLEGSEGLKYQIIAKIGEGGMGYIYEARRTQDQKKVIVKYLPPRDFKSIKSVVRFVQEAHTVLSFKHENLVTGYDMIMDRNRCFYVMEFIEGKTVEQLIRMENKMRPDRAVRIVLQVARALQCLEEEHNLVHRDIKPSNIMVMDNGFVKLVDFGIAKVSNHHLTTVGIILGTPYYLSPEQIQGQEITIQSDIYSLGATFYHMVTGEHPFQGADVYSIIHQRLNRDPKDPRQFNTSLPRAVAQIILRMMEQKPNKRYPTARALIQDLENILRAMDSGTLPLEADRPLAPAPQIEAAS